MTPPQQKPGKSEQVFRTPRPLIQAALAHLKVELFVFDFAADASNTVATRYWDQATNALAQSPDAWAAALENAGEDPWGWCNPPFARIAPWVERCWQTVNRGGQVALLVPAAVGSNWWRDYVHGRAYVLFLNGRPCFLEDRPTWGYPKDCALVLYSSDWNWEATYKVWPWKETS